MVNTKGNNSNNPSRPYVLGRMGKHYSNCYLQSQALRNRLERLVCGGSDPESLRKITLSQHSLIDVAVTSEFLAMATRVDLRRADDGKAPEIAFRDMAKARTQIHYFKKERALAERQLGLIDVEVRSSSGRSEGLDPFAELDADAERRLTGGSDAEGSIGDGEVNADDNS